MVNDIVLTSKGINAPYFKSGSSNISTTGILRLANNEGIGFRNAANSADLILKVNATNGLEYNGGLLGVLAAALTASRALVSDSSGNVSVANTTTTELNYLAGVTAPTGSGALVLANSPTLITPTLGVASATSINKVAITAPATGSTLVLADGKTLTVSNTLTFTGTDASSVAFGTGGAVAYAAGAFPLSAQYALITDINGLINVSTVTQTRLQYLASAGGTTGTTSTNLVFSTSPTLVTPTLGVASATSINKVAITAPATGSTLTVADGKTLTASNTLTMTATDGSTAAFGAGGTVVYEAATQTLAAKTLTAPIIDQANFTQAASATTPASGKSAVYVNSGDAKLHVVDSSGNDVAVGSGSSGRNYLSDWYDSAKAESVGTSAATSTGNRTVAGNTDPTKWVTSDLTNLTFARSADTTLRQSYNYLINSGDANADFVESPLFTLDGRDLGKPISVSFDCAGVSASDDYQVCAVRYNSSGTYQEVITIAGTASATTPYSARIPVGTTSFNGFFVAGATATDQYAIRFMKHAVNVDLRIDSLYVGPQSVVQGAAVTDWQSTTMTLTASGGGSVATGTGGNPDSTLWWRRVGSSMELMGTWRWGTTSASFGTSGYYRVGIPNSLSLDTTKMPTVNGMVVGSGYFYDSSAADFFAATPTIQIDTGVAYLFFSASESPAGSTIGPTFTANVDGGTASTVTIATGDIISFSAVIPISTWSSNVTMANRAVESYLSYDDSSATTANTTYNTTAKMVYGASGSPFYAIASTTAAQTTKYRITPPQTLQPTDLITLEISTDSGKTFSAASNSSNIAIYSNQADAFYGMYCNPNYTSNYIEVGFGNKGRIPSETAATAYAANGRTWNDLTGGTYKWRVRVVSGGASVGYPVSTANIVGRTDGVTVGSGYIGEIKTSSGSATSLTSGQYSDGGAAALSLEPGVWDIQVITDFNPTNASTSITGYICGIGTATGNSAAGLSLGENYVKSIHAAVVPGLNADFVVCSPVYRVNISTTTSYYAKCSATFTVSTLTGANYIRARRVG